MGKIITWVQRGIAVGAGALTAYNVGVESWDQGIEHANEEIAKRDTDLFVKSQTSSVQSHLLERAKAYVRQVKFDNRLYPVVVKTKHVVSQFIQETAGSLVNIAGVAGVLIPAFMKTKNPIVQKYIPAASTILLLINNGKIIISDVLGTGKKGL